MVVQVQVPGCMPLQVVASPHHYIQLALHCRNVLPQRRLQAAGVGAEAVRMPPVLVPPLLQQQRQRQMQC